VSDQVYEPPPGGERRRGYPPASRQEVSEMREQQEALDRSVRGLHSQLRSLDASLRDFMPRREVEAVVATRQDVEKLGCATRRRRLALTSGMGLAVIFAVHAQDAHVEHCRPLQHGGTVDAPSGVTAALCDVMAPTHMHDGLFLPGLNAWNVLGLALWLALILALVVIFARNVKGQHERRPAATRAAHGRATGSWATCVTGR
jgi:hypothetical protein